jgi:hypothetical protein
MVDHLALAAHAYAYAEEHYCDKDARFDVIVECMGKSEIAAELSEQGITDTAGAEAWAKRRAGLHHEQELNQAWDGPESVKSSSRYDPAHDPAGPTEADELAHYAHEGAVAFDPDEQRFVTFNDLREEKWS